MDWIDIKDRLPPEYFFVLVYAQMSGTGEPCPISIARYEGKEWDIIGDDLQSNACACGDLFWGIESHEITHWMPLPELPRDK
jgi:hypothetical protein